MATEDDWIDLTRREFAEIPVIDLRLSHEELVPALAQACEHPVRARCIRCTRHVNHVNPPPLTGGCRAASQGFFYLEGLPVSAVPTAATRARVRPTPLARPLVQLTLRLRVRMR